jgi:hypothetical protein
MCVAADDYVARSAKRVKIATAGGAAKLRGVNSRACAWRGDKRNITASRQRLRGEMKYGVLHGA